MNNIVTSMLLFGMATSSTTDQQFDLICEGTEKTTDKGVTSSSKWLERFRVDLESKLYCRGDCSKLIKIHQVLPSEIFFRNFQSVGGAANLLIVNRMDGKLTELSSYEYHTQPRTVEVKVSAHCTRVNFSKLPERKF